ncbi:MAG: hypothetical protein OXF27_14885 [Acidobacteria bacterium]|nr:hypothetical protein [Acidobacteriota bacterium]MCY4601193.1 hypothetical protein [Acidobacteriota bacterium]
MNTRILELIGLAVVLAAVVGLLTWAPAPAAVQAQAIVTAWGEPDLQGIWTDPYTTPLERPARFADQDVFTDAERAALDEQRSAHPRRDAREGVGTDRDVRGAYNAVYMSIKPTGPRTSLIVDPPDGRIPPLTAEAEARTTAQREFRLALLQATATCRDDEPACAGWQYGPPSPLRAERSPYYNTARLNRNDGPEDRSLSERCMGAGLPDFGGYRRIVQSPGAVSIFYDVGQGQGWQRTIPVTDRPHIPSTVRQWRGDSRGRWEGATLVVDVANFGAKTDVRGSRENLRLVERWTRLDAETLEYIVTVEDPTTWTRSWTVRQELILQDGQANRIYTEPRCHEGNYGLPAQLVGSRVEEQAFAEGRGPDPATRDTATGGGDTGGADPLTGR